MKIPGTALHCITLPGSLLWNSGNSIVTLRSNNSNLFPNEVIRKQDDKTENGKSAFFVLTPINSFILLQGPCRIRRYVSDSITQGHAVQFY